MNQAVPVNLGQIRSTLVQVRRLESLPTTLHPVICEIGSHCVSVQLRIKFAAGVMAVQGGDQVASGPILIRAIPADTRSSVTLGLSQGFPDCLIMRGNQSLVSADQSLNRDRFWRRVRQI